MRRKTSSLPGRRWVPQGGVVEYGAFAYDVPTSWYLDYPSLDICLTRFYSTIQPETDVSVHTTENTLFPEGMDDEGWEAMKSQITDVSRTETGLTFSTPEFYRYTLTDGTDILYYTFVGEDGAKRIQYAVENVIEIGFDQWFYAPDTIDLIELNLTTLEDIAVLPNLQILNLEIGGVSDYDALGNAKKLTELRIYSQEFPEDTEWLKELPDLKVLSLGASYIGALNALGFEKEEGSTFGKKDFQKGYAGTGELEENLSQCMGLLYLQLEYSGPLTYGFLDKLTNLYTFIRYAEDELVDKNDGKAWAKEWNESKCPQIKCLVLGEQWLRNPE